MANEATHAFDEIGASVRRWLATLDGEKLRRCWTLDEIIDDFGGIGPHRSLKSAKQRITPVLDAAGWSCRHTSWRPPGYRPPLGRPPVSGSGKGATMSFQAVDGNRARAYSQAARNANLTFSEWARILLDAELANLDDST